MGKVPRNEADEVIFAWLHPLISQLSLTASPPKGEASFGEERTYSPPTLSAVILSFVWTCAQNIGFYFRYTINGVRGVP